MNGISLQSLRMFLAVVEHGSVSAAGRELGVSQPAVSGHLHTLEERYGLVLLDRGRSMRPTLAGEALARHARLVLSACREMEEEMAQQSEPGGVLEVGASTTPAEVIVPGVAVRFSGRYPSVNLKVAVGDTNEVLGSLRSREIEVAFVGLLPDGDEFDAKILGEDRLAVIVPAASDVQEMAVGDLGSQVFVMREEGSATRRAAEEILAGAGFTVRPGMELGSNAAIAGAVAEGAGTGIVPERVVVGDSRIKSVPVQGLELSRPLVLVTGRGRTLSPAAEAFIEVCAEVYGV